MNKRHYEHTLPNIRGSLSNTYHKTPIGYLKNIYDFPFDVDNHQDFFNLPFCAFACFTVFLVHLLSFM